MFASCVGQIIYEIHYPKGKKQSNKLESFDRFDPLLTLLTFCFKGVSTDVWFTFLRGASWDSMLLLYSERPAQGFLAPAIDPMNSFLTNLLNSFGSCAREDWIENCWKCLIAGCSCCVCLSHTQFHEHFQWRLWVVNQHNLDDLWS